MKQYFSAGMVYVTLSALLFAFYGVWSRLLSDSFSPFSATWTRSLIIIALLLPFVLWRRVTVRIKKVHLGWLAASFVSGSLVLPMSFYGFKHIDVGPGTLIFFAVYVLSQYAIGFVLYKEEITLRKITSLVLGLMGLSLITAQQFSVQAGLLPVLAMVGAGVCSAFEVGLSKKYSEHYSGLYLTCLLYCVAFIMSFIGDTLLMEQSMIATDIRAWAIQIGFSITSILAFVCVLRGFKQVDPSVGGILGLLEIVFGVILGIAVFNESLSLAIFTGLTMIICSALLPYFGKGKLR